MLPGSMMPSGSARLRLIDLISVSPRKAVLFGTGVALGVLAVLTCFSPRDSAVYNSPGATTVIVVERPASRCPYLNRLRADELVREYCRTGRAADALSLIDALLRYPNSPDRVAELHFLRGGVLRALDQDAAAREEFRKVALTGIWNIYSEDEPGIQAASGDISQTLAACRKAISDPNSETAEVNNACWDLALSPGGDPAEAAEVMAGIVRNRRQPDDRDTYAWCLYLSGSKQAAIQQEELAIQEAQQRGAVDLRYFGACLAGFCGQTELAARELRSLYLEDITNPSPWTAARRFETSAPA